MNSQEYFLELYNLILSENSALELLQLATLPLITIFVLRNLFVYIYDRIHGTRVEGTIVEYPKAKRFFGIKPDIIDKSLKYSSKPIVRYKLPNQSEITERVSRMSMDLKSNLYWLQDDGRITFLHGHKTGRNTPAIDTKIDLIITDKGKVIVDGLTVFYVSMVVFVVWGILFALLAPDYHLKVHDIELDKNFSWHWIKALFLSYVSIFLVCLLKDSLKLLSYFKQKP